ncbi:MAG: alpha/beta hydrolase, partial [Pseudonocardiaceae bacterium]
MPLAARRRAMLPAVLAAVIGAVAGCTVGPSDRPPVAVRDAGVPPGRPPASPQPPPPPQLPPPGRYDPTSLPWADCTGRLAPLLDGAAPARIECSEFTAEADLAIPGLAGSVRLDLTRVGSGPAPLVVLGEAGGEPGTLRAARLAAQAPPGLLDTYTLIGLARRGTGPAEPIDCIPQHTRARIIGADPNPRGRGQLDDLLDTARTAIQTCVQQLNQLLTAIDSPATADDLEQLRVELNAPVLHVLSLGEASRAAADYVDRYPLSVGRVVLDGAPDPTLDDIGAAQARARAAEAGFDTFARDCVDRGCPLGPAPRRALGELVDTLRTAPLNTPELPVTAGTALHAVLETVGSPERWPELAAALA